MDWKKLLEKKVRPPFIPKIVHDIDVSNFDREFTECEIESPGDGSEICNDLPDFSYERSPTNENPLVESIKEDKELGDNFVMEVEE